MFAYNIINLLGISRSDLHENSSIMELLSYQPPWVDEYRQINDGVQVEDVGM